MPSIMIIDDDKLVRETTMILLRAKGYAVDAAADGKSGIEAIRAGRFDLVIVDLFMPGMDGLKVIEAIRQSHPSIPVIAASGFMFVGECPQMPSFESIAKEAGANSTLYKPFRPADVLQAVEQAIGIAA